MRRTTVLLAVVAMVVTAALPVSAGNKTKEVQRADGAWHGQVAATKGPDAPGSKAKIVRSDDGFRYRYRARNLNPGHAYSLWVVVFNDPASCEGPCGGDDARGGRGDAQIFGRTGAVANDMGKANIRGHVGLAAEIDGWIDGGGFTNAMGAEIHFVLNDHGPVIEGREHEMTNTYRGGCSDDSPFPGIFPPTAINDGEPGPNTCLLYQFAIFLPVDA